MKTPPLDSSLRFSRAVHGRRGLLLAAATALATCAVGLSACATADNELETEPKTEPAPVPPPTSPPADDSGAPVDATAPCTIDCEYFPPECTADVLCPNGLFDPAKPQGGPGQLDLRTTIHLVRGRSENDVWVLGALGAVARFDGTSWTRVDLPRTADAPDGRPPTPRSLWLRDDYEVGFVAFQSVYARGRAEADGGTVTWAAPQSTTMPAMPVFQAAAQLVTYGWGAPGAEWYWVATQAWSPTAYGAMWGLVRVRPTGAVGFGGEVAATGLGTFASIHGASADELWAVGLDGVAVRVSGADGASPTTTTYNSQTRNPLYGVWAAAPSDVWAVGGSGTIRHYTGDALVWDVVPNVPENVHLNAVWGSSASDIWAVGANAVVLHYDGTGWSRMKIGGLGARRPNLTTVWTSGPGHVWVGGEGVVLSLGGKP